jgi:hypothetical protein
MPNTSTAKKNLRKNERRKEINKVSKIKIKKARIEVKHTMANFIAKKCNESEIVEKIRKFESTSMSNATTKQDKLRYSRYVSRYIKLMRKHLISGVA